MTSRYDTQNLRYTGNLINPNAPHGTVMLNNGTDNFELLTPSANGQVLVSNASTSAGAQWSVGPQGVAVGYGIGNGITPNIGNTMYFLTVSSTAYVPAIPTPVGTIIYFSVRPDNGTATSGGWSTNPSFITGGTLDYTFGYIGATQAPTMGNFTPYAGGPHVQIQGTSINGIGTTDYATFSFNLNIPVLVSGQQLCVRLVNNLTVSPAEPSWTQQNAYIIIRS